MAVHRRAASPAPPGPPRIRVGVVDDHPAVVLGITAIVNAQQDMSVVASGPSVTVLLAEDRRLDVVLLDLALGDTSTPTGNVRALGAICPVLVYTAGDQPQLVREAGRAGAIGMVRKSERPDVIVTAIRTAAGGEVVASADWAAAVDADGGFVSAQLTARESEVLGLYAVGETADRVATELFISRETVLDHIRRIRAKYAAVDRTAPTKVDLHRRAIEDGLISAEPSGS